ncbi:MAG: sulfatase-like hydrolase/transferase [Woeseia sp.]
MNSTVEASNRAIAVPPDSADRRLSTVVLAVAFSLFSVLLYLPGALYFSNINEFSLRLDDLLLIFLPAWLVSVVCGVALVFLLPRVVRGRLVSVLFGLGLLLWMQGSLLVWQYGTFDGRGIQWDTFWTNGMIDSPVWVLVFALALAAPAKFIKTGRVAAMVVMAVQCTLLLLSAVAAQWKTDDPSVRNYAIDNTPKYAFSGERNVILIVLDAYQSDVFQEIIAQEPEYSDYFDGFTYFRDAVAGSNYTELAIPALLTGRMYDNSQRREDFLREAFLEYGITTRLKHDGFIVDIYPWVGWGNESIYFDEAIASNLTKIDAQEVSEPTFTEKKGKEALHLLDLSFFRAAPHFLKRFVYNDQKWFITYAATYFLPEGVKKVVSTDNQFAISTFLAQAPSALPIDRGTRVFKYFHLAGVHSPLEVDEELNFTNQVFPFSRRSYVLQAKANLRYLQEFFEKLQDAGIYDNSLILVLGDHGSGESPEMYIEPANAGTKPLQLEGTKRNFRRDKARAIPLVLIKRIGASAPLEISNAPVSLRDVPATIISELELETSTERPSMFHLDPRAPRVRYHGAFEFSPNKSGFVDAITLYRIEGDSWLNESWTVDGILTPVMPQGSK